MAIFVLLLEQKLRGQTSSFFNYNSELLVSLCYIQSGKKLDEKVSQLISIAKEVNIYQKKDRACRGWGKKLQGRFLISSIGNVKPMIFLIFQSWDREVRLTLYDRA